MPRTLRNPNERVAVTISGDALRVLRNALEEAAVAAFYPNLATLYREMAAELAAIHRGDTDHIGDAIAERRRAESAADRAELARREGRKPA